MTPEDWMVTCRRGLDAAKALLPKILDGAVADPLEAYNDLLIAVGASGAQAGSG